jgi:two-component system sensor histidine kinase KdpD
MLHAPWLGYAVAVLAVAVVSVLIALVQRQIQIANISMFYLTAVLVTATAFGSGPAILAAVAAFVTFDWFFVEPRYTYTVADPEEWIALLLFLATAVITGQLAAEQRRRAGEAARREREAVVLYDVARLMGEPDFVRALQTVAERLRQELSLAGVGIELQGDDGTAARALAGDEEGLQLLASLAPQSAQILAEGRAPSATQAGAPGRWVRIVSPRTPFLRLAGVRERVLAVPIKASDRRLGTIQMVRPENAPRFTSAENRILSAVAAHVGLAAERNRLRREATESEILRRADELKTALLNAVSHDVRTPLASIIAAAGSLRQEDVAWTEADRREFAQAIEEEAQRLNRIFGNLLDLSRIEGGSLRPEIGWYDLATLVHEVLGRLRSVAARHRVVVDVPDDLPPVPLDYVEIDQVLSNLVENATRYTPPGTEISVTARGEDGQVRIEVADRGPGIPPGALARLFERFFRAEAGDGRPKPRGTGLGLAIARGLVEAHGGRLWAENRPGGGARFVFTLPLNAETGAALSAESTP